MKMLELQDVNAYYGDSHVIQGLSLYANKGEAVSILGRNGVGKTTTFRAIMGFTPPRSGSIRIAGIETTGWPPHKVVTEGGLAYIPAERHIFADLSVKENLKLAERRPHGRSIWNIDRVYRDFPILRVREKQDGATLSGGEQQMLAIARGLMGNPRTILLDEPSQGLAPMIIKTVVEIVQELCKGEDFTLILVEQNFRVAMKLATRHYLMDIKGKINCDMTNEECIDDMETLKRHLSI
ncbi:MAG: ABC transporter ATP-binding protein [Deltaproteobacteria bacterium]|nr:ABC transporter ATP-binding protein [Deltaproteobacteria bacterium]